MKLPSYLLMACVMASGCAASRPDHFYALSVQPAQTHASGTGFGRQIGLHVTLPSLVDRSELVLNSHDQVSILEHQRWASPLLDQFSSTLGQDIEARRADLIIANRSLEQGKLPSSKISLEIVSWTAQRGGQVSLETRWRITDSVSANVTVGRDTVSAPMDSDGYEQIAAAISRCIAQLADKLVAQIPQP